MSTKTKSAVSDPKSVKEKAEEIKSLLNQSKKSEILNKKAIPEIEKEMGEATKELRKQLALLEAPFRRKIRRLEKNESKISKSRSSHDEKFREYMKPVYLLIYEKEKIYHPLIKAIALKCAKKDYQEWGWIYLNVKEGKVSWQVYWGHNYPEQKVKIASKWLDEKLNLQFDYSIGWNVTVYDNGNEKSGKHFGFISGHSPHTIHVEGIQLLYPHPGYN